MPGRLSRWRRRTALTVTAALAAPLLALSAAPAQAASGSDHSSGRSDHSQGRNVAQQLDVATYNLYLGADLNPLFGASSLEDLIGRAAGVYARVQQTDFPERSRTLARLIARERPDVIGLQEVGLWETAPLGTSDFTTTYDFLATLQADLAAANVPYRAVATNQNFSSRDLNLTVPISATTQVAYTDRDVILVRELPGRERLTATNPREEVFEAFAPVPLLGGTIPVLRGFSSVDVNKGGLVFRFYNTHLEAFDGPDGPVKTAQARELAADINASPLPVVVVGDVNSRPTGCENINTQSYATLENSGGGLEEVWPVAQPRDPCGGFTSGQDEDLRNAESTLDHRIDVIFYDPQRFRARKTDVIGDEQRDRTPESSLWPSDHAGSVATLRTVR